MKHLKHESRKSFRKWAMPLQREQTQAAEALDFRRIKAMAQGRKTHILNIGKNNGPMKHSVPAQNISTQFRLHKHSCVKDVRGIGARVIESWAYQPEPKSPSRRDKHRETVRASAAK